MPSFPTITGAPAGYPDKRYMTVRNSYTSALTRGQLVAWCSTDDDGISVDLADTNSSPALTAAVGVVVDETIAAGAFGRVQTHGFCNYVTTDGSVDAGEFLAPGTTGGAAAGVAAASTTATACGYALADDSSTTLTAAILFCKVP